jgi:hypothetical protein
MTLTTGPDQLDFIGSEIDRKLELRRRIERLPAGRYDFSILVTNLTRDRRDSKEMQKILAAGDTHYLGKTIMGSKSDPYVQRFSRAEVKAQLTCDLDRVIGAKPEPEKSK